MSYSLNYSSANMSCSFPIVSKTFGTILNIVEDAEVHVKTLINNVLSKKNKNADSLACQNPHYVEAGMRDTELKLCEPAQADILCETAWFKLWPLESRTPSTKSYF